LEIGRSIKALSATATLKSDAAEYAGDSLKTALQKYELEYIRQAIKSTGGNVTKAAENLGVHRSYIYRKIKSE